MPEEVKTPGILLKLFFSTSVCWTIVISVRLFKGLGFNGPYFTRFPNIRTCAFRYKCSRCCN